MYLLFYSLLNEERKQRISLKANNYRNPHNAPEPRSIGAGFSRHPYDRATRRDGGCGDWRRKSVLLFSPDSNRNFRYS